MLFRLSRALFWLAAAAAALALLVPGAPASLLTGIALVASTVAFGLWRSAVRTQQRSHHMLSAVPGPALLTDASLREAAATLVRQADAAVTFEAALHVVACVLRGELGARQATVGTLHEITETHAHIADLIESRPGFQAVPRRVRLASTALDEALRGQRPAGVPPDAVVLPVTAAGQVVAVIELTGIELPVDPEALTGLLELAQLTLSKRAQAADANAPALSHGHAADLHILGGLASDVEDNGVRAEVGAEAPSGRQFDRVFVDTPLSGGQRLRESGFDDHVSKPFRQDQVLSVLKTPRLRLHAPAEAHQSVASGPVAAPAVLDALALSRLTELDPTGENRLLERVLQAFQTSVARLRPQAEAAHATGDRAGLRLVAHTLKSSSASIGALHLSQLCAQIETTIRLESGDNLDAQIDALGVALDSVLQAIAQLLKDRA